MSPSGTKKVPPTYEAAVEELERIVSSMEAGQLPLEQSLEAYRRGSELLKYCQAQLADARQKVQVLEGDSLQDFRDTQDQS